MSMANSLFFFVFSVLLVTSLGLPVTLPKYSPTKGLKRLVKPTDKKNMFSPNSPVFYENSDKSSTNAVPFTPRGISFHGGKVLSAGINVYIVWYGSWTSTPKNIILSFIKSLGPQKVDKPNSVRRWWNINGLYYNASNKFPLQNISVKKHITDNYSFGRFNLSYNDIANIVYSKMLAATLPFDSNGIYLVLTSSDVTVRQYYDGSSYCAAISMTFFLRSN